MLTHKSIFILDTHGLLYQLFHALPPMSSPKGEPVGVVYGFAKDMFTLIERHKPHYIFCAFDLPGKTFRSEIYAEYKANRSEMPDDLKPQIGFVHEILEAMNVPQLSLPGYEADDIIATVARLTSEQHGNCVIVTNDKDCRQLINEHVSIFNFRKQIFYKTEELRADWGITPSQVVDFQTLVGDSTDNIPGVQKVGPKTATELLQQFGTLEGIYENIEKITGKKKEHLLDGKESAMLSRRLVQLSAHVPVEITWSEYQGIDEAKLSALFQRFGFKSLMEKTTDCRQRTATSLLFPD
jgi:DNA polymerase-1